MNDDLDVVIIRTNSNEEIIGISNGVNGDVVYIEFPHYIKYVSQENSLGIVPYCPFTDQIEYQFKIKDIKFMAPAKKIVQSVFLNKVLGLDDDQPEDNIRTFTVAGNQTYH